MPIARLRGLFNDSEKMTQNYEGSHRGGKKEIADMFTMLPIVYIDNYGFITLDDTETDNETYEMSKPMASVIFSRCSVNTFIRFYLSHFNRSRYLSWSRSV